MCYNPDCNKLHNLQTVCNNELPLGHYPDKVPRAWLPFVLDTQTKHLSRCLILVGCVPLLTCHESDIVNTKCFDIR